MKTILSAFALIFSLSLFTQNNLIQLSGQITDKKNEVQVGAIVQTTRSNVGIATEGAEKSSLKISLKFPLVVLVNSLGYEAQEFNVEGEKSEKSRNSNQKTKLTLNNF
jgi:hypothetical protein